MDVSTPPSLDLACPQAEADNDIYVHMFRGRGVDKKSVKPNEELKVEFILPSSSIEH